MKKHLVTGLVLAAFALICGALLALVNHFTSPVIKAHEDERIQNSIAEVYEPFSSGNYTKEEFHADSIILGYFIINKDTNEKEAVIYVVESQGFASKIRMMIGVDKELKITGYTVISQSETKGDVSTHDFNVTGKSNLDDFDKLAGSSVSSKAVKKNFSICLNRAKEDLGVPNE